MSPAAAAGFPNDGVTASSAYCATEKSVTQSTIQKIALTFGTVSRGRTATPADFDVLIEDMSFVTQSIGTIVAAAPADIAPFYRSIKSSAAQSMSQLQGELTDNTSSGQWPKLVTLQKEFVADVNQAFASQPVVTKYREIHCGLPASFGYGPRAS